MGRKTKNELEAKELLSISDCVKRTHSYFKENCERYHFYMNFAFYSSLSDSEKQKLSALGKPEMEFNIIEQGLSLLRGEFSKQEPSFTVTSTDLNQISERNIELVEGFTRNILEDANDNSFSYNLYTDLLAGGFGVAKVYTEYAHEKSFNQVIRYKRCHPTMCGFDINAQTPHKGDGQYAFEMYTKTHDEIISEFGSDLKKSLDEMKRGSTLGGEFRWQYKNVKNQEDIFLLCEFFKKVPKKTKLYELANNQVMLADEYQDYIEQWEQQEILAQPPAIVRERDTTVHKIKRFICLGNKIIESNETDFKYLPLVFFDGNSAEIQRNDSVTQMTRPYIYNAKDLQRLKNAAGQTLAHEITTMQAYKIMTSEEAISERYADHLLYPQDHSILIYKSIDDVTNERNEAPREMQRTQTPPEVAQTFSQMDRTIQSVLGASNAALMQNDKDISGKALQESMLATNASSMPYVVGYMQGLNQMAKITVDLMPKYNKTASTIPVLNKDGSRSYIKINDTPENELNFDSSALEVKVEAGPSFGIQKERALKQIQDLCQSIPGFANLFQAFPEALNIVMDNIDIRGADKLKELAQQYSQQVQQQKQQQEQMQQQQAQQPNPMMIKLQELKQKQEADALKHQEAMAKIEADLMKIQLDAQNSHNSNLVQAAKAQAEEINDEAQMQMQSNKFAHEHFVNTLKATHEMKKSENNNEQEIE